MRDCADVELPAAPRGPTSYRGFSDGAAAVDEQRLTRDVAGVFRQHEGNSCRDLLDVPDAASECL